MSFDASGYPPVYDVAIYRHDEFLTSFEIVGFRISEAKLEALQKAREHGLTGDIRARIIEQDI
jgi:hypothetical protein